MIKEGYTMDRRETDRLIMETKVARPKQDIIHKDKAGQECGDIIKVINDAGEILYECKKCHKQWATGEKATPVIP